jgi:hypothetical protein
LEEKEVSSNKLRGHMISHSPSPQSPAPFIFHSNFHFHHGKKFTDSSMNFYITATSPGIRLLVDGNEKAWVLLKFLMKLDLKKS